MGHGPAVGAGALLPHKAARALVSSLAPKDFGSVRAGRILEGPLTCGHSCSILDPPTSARGSMPYAVRMWEPGGTLQSLWSTLSLGDWPVSWSGSAKLGW